MRASTLANFVNNFEGMAGWSFIFPHPESILTVAAGVQWWTIAD
jgi:hypothetical protein